MATSDPFEVALKEARKALQEAFEQKNEIENRIVSLKQTIEGLSALVEPEVGELVELRRPGLLTVETSLTDAIRKVFANSSEDMLTPPQVRDALLAMGIDLAKYKQPLVPIHNTLKRLAKQREIVAFENDKGDIRGYRWVSPLVRAIAEVDSSQRTVPLSSLLSPEPQTRKDRAVQIMMKAREEARAKQEGGISPEQLANITKVFKRAREQSMGHAFDSEKEEK